MEATINKIDQELRLLADSHLQINSYFYGEFLDIYESKKVNHTSLLAHVKDASIDKHFVTLQLGLMVCDKIDDGKQVAKYVDSSTLDIINDIITVIKTSKRWQKYGIVSDSTNVQNFSEKGGSVLNGWFCALSFKVKKKNGYCDMPIINYDYEV